VTHPGMSDLSQRLHDELDRLDIGQVPVNAIFRKSRTMTRRRLAGVTCAVVAGAVVVGLLGARLGTEHAGRSANGANWPSAGSPAHGVFARGSVHGKQWRLALVNLADPRLGCRPGVVLNGTAQSSAGGDLLQQPRFLPGLQLGDVGLDQPGPGYTGPGWAFVWLQPGVHDLAAMLRDGNTIDLRPVTVRICGESFRLAGFRYPRPGVLAITASSASGQRITYKPPASSRSWRPPVGRGIEQGAWFNAGGTVQGKMTTGMTGSGRAGRATWRAWVSLGPDGECFALLLNQASLPPGFVGYCGPIGEPSQGAALHLLPVIGPAVWYTGAVNQDTAYASVLLSDGVRMRITPRIVDRRLYVAFGARPGTKLVKMTMYDDHGVPLGSITARNVIQGW
jgi:hypothetical protein